MKIALPVLRGLAFGLTSGVITTLGLMVGLYAGTHSKQAVLGGILTIAIADAMSDALGMHLSEEFAARVSARQVWLTTAVTFTAKLLMALTFALPVIWLDLHVAIGISIAWGLLVVGLLSASIAHTQGEKVWKVVGEHVVVIVLVVLATYAVGNVIEGWG
ncbi:MAG: hypothetical protein OEW08_13920 [Gammaproteobacteria bacterium]|nr:hypothetical protein [Gammaproteobacteria bacterium]